VKQKYTDDNIKNVQKKCNSQQRPAKGVAIFSPFLQKKNDSLNKQFINLLRRSVSPALSGGGPKDFPLTGVPTGNMALASCRFEWPYFTAYLH
jgi:hypothetical protein